MEYFTLLTQLGAAKIAAATAANTTVNLTHIAVGDGNGVVPMPDASKTALVNEVFRTNLNDLAVDTNNDNWVITEGYISSNDGNFWIREVGIFDVDGDLIAIGNYPETFKPVMADGVAKDLYIKVIIEVSSSDAITLQIDPSVVLATRDYVDKKDALKANLNGSSSEKFKVANATSPNDAVAKGQLFGIGDYTNNSSIKSEGSVNDLLITGFYSVSEICSDLPTTGNFDFIVHGRASTYTKQIAFCATGGEHGKMFIREQHSGHWFSWKEIQTGSDEVLLNENGYMKLSSGLIIQWGKGNINTNGDSLLSVIFPISFPNKVLNASWTPLSNSLSTVIGSYITGLTNSGMILVADKNTSITANIQYTYLVIGH